MFKIACFRSSASIFGAASAYMKADGVELTWTDRAEAERECARLTTLVGMSSRVSYRVVEVVDGHVVLGGES